MPRIRKASGEMRLSQINKSISRRVFREGEFESLGFVSHEAPAMLVFLEDRKYLASLLRNSQIACVITSEQYVDDLPAQFGIAVSDCPRRTFYEIHNFLTKETEFYWTSFPSSISESAEIHPTAYIADSDVRIGKRVIVEPNVTILERVIVEDDVIVRAGTIIGSEGFEFNLIDGCMIPVVHAGGVLLHSRVEVQSNCCIDKSVFGGFTELGEDTKLDNMVHIAHNVRIGERCRLAACAMLAGSVTMGDDVWVGPSVSVSSEVHIGDKANLTIGSVVTKDVAPGQRVSGNFAIEHRKFLRFIGTIR